MDRNLIKRCLNEIGIAFLFAPNLHTVMRHVMPARKQIATKTMFNILGPLINPARATNQLIGVYSSHWTKVLAEVLHNLGSRHVLVVHDRDGLDEVTTTEKTIISEVSLDSRRDYEMAPEELGFKRAKLSDLIVKDREENKRIVLEVLGGRQGAHRDIVLLNAACAIYAADKAKTIQEAILLAKKSIDSGAAQEKLELLKEYSHAQS
jgi:anthranilate phosphoribosyltransferase